MKRICVAAVIHGYSNGTEYFLLGRRGKDPNRGLYVLPGGGLQDNESLEEALLREIWEETSLPLEKDNDRWGSPGLIELPDRIILVVDAFFEDCPPPAGGSDLYDIGWFRYNELPTDLSPVIISYFQKYGYFNE